MEHGDDIDAVFSDAVVDCIGEARHLRFAYIVPDLGVGVCCHAKGCYDLSNCSRENRTAACPASLIPVNRVVELGQREAS